MVGLPRAIIKKYGVTKKAWAVYRGKRKSLHSYVKKASKKARRANIKMARRRLRRYGRGGGKSLQKSMFKLIRGGALAAPLVQRAIEYRAAPARIPVWALRDYTGLDLDDGSWDPTRMARGYGGFVGACLATYGIPKIVGLLRKL